MWLRDPEKARVRSNPRGGSLIYSTTEFFSFSSDFLFTVLVPVEILSTPRPRAHGQASRRPRLAAAPAASEAGPPAADAAYVEVAVSPLQPLAFLGSLRVVQGSLCVLAARTCGDACATCGRQ